MMPDVTSYSPPVFNNGTFSHGCRIGLDFGAFWILLKYNSEQLQPACGQLEAMVQPHLNDHRFPIPLAVHINLDLTYFQCIQDSPDSFLKQFFRML